MTGKRKLLDKRLQKMSQSFSSGLAIATEPDQGGQSQRMSSDITHNSCDFDSSHFINRSVNDCRHVRSQGIRNYADSHRGALVCRSGHKNSKAFHFDSIGERSKLLLFLGCSNHVIGCQDHHFQRREPNCGRKQASSIFPALAPRQQPGFDPLGEPLLMPRRSQTLYTPDKVPPEARWLNGKHSQRRCPSLQNRLSHFRFLREKHQH